VGACDEKDWGELTSILGSETVFLKNARDWCSSKKKAESKKGACPPSAKHTPGGRGARESRNENAEGGKFASGRGDVREARECMHKQTVTNT